MFQKRIDVIREKLANIEKETEEMHLDIQPLSKPKRHGMPWTEFEKAKLIEALNHLVNHYALAYGRTKLSIILFISNHISRGLQ